MYRAVAIYCAVVVFVVARKEIFDVTTVYRVGEIYKNTTDEHKAETHLLSNARGLPVRYDKIFLDKPVTQRQFPVCQSYECSWDIEGWDWVVRDSIIYYSDTHRFQNVSTEIKYLKNVKVPSLLGVKLKKYNNFYDNHMRLFLYTQTAKLLRELPELYTIYLRLDYPNTNIYIYYCGVKLFGRSYLDFDGETFGASCTSLYSAPMDVVWSNHDENAVYYLVANFSSEGFYIWSDVDKQSVKLDWKPPTPMMNIKYLSMSISTQLKATVQSAVLKPTAETYLTSPWFTASMDKLCLAIIAQGDAVLNITVENIQLDEYFLGKSAINDFKNVMHFTATIPEELRGGKIRLKLNFGCSSNFTVERISSCTDEGEIFILNSDDLDTLQSKPVFDVTIENDIGWCFNNPDATRVANGGCAHEELSTACLPGFTGHRCETACGRNAFGSDCKGVCSAHTEECQGLQLCTTAFGCQCAPGFHGSTCEEMCTAGSYGNNCVQTCGHCIDQSSCDVYTGHCTLCAPGYFPPYCKDTYPVITIVPDVSSTKFGEAIVKYDLDHYSGRGQPVMYQLQYRKSKVLKEWITFEADEIPKRVINIDEPLSSAQHQRNLESLEDGVLYDVRVIMLTENLESYQGNDVPFNTFLSLCTIPKSVDYHIIAQSNSTALTISWQYKNTSEHWCPVEHFQVYRKEGLKWIAENTTDTYYVVSDLLPGFDINLKVRAYTSGGLAPFSNISTVSTKIEVPGPVKALSIRQSDTSIAQISWSPPDNVGSEKINYHIYYQCVKRVSCNRACKPEDSNKIVVAHTNETLNSLLPFTIYHISVSAGGRNVTRVFGTKATEPSEIVSETRPSVWVTNISVTVHWSTVEVCSGFFKGYFYQVYKTDELLEKILVKEAITSKPHFSLDQLTPHTEYFADIFIKTVAGWRSDKYLRINFSTLPSVPEQVINLTVYKRGRSLLGLRWAKPVKLYGELASFTVSYDNTSLTVHPTPCGAWSHLYCFTVDNLRPNRVYSFNVSARNEKLSQDGTPASVTGITKESIPGTPEDFQIVNSTSTTFALSWKYPLLANGIVRSFLLSVEETEQFDSDSCCQIFPMQEEVVTEELAEYVIELSGLHPASTYTVSLSAKTVSIGPSLTLTVYTRPPPMTVALPTVSVNSEKPLAWPRQAEVNNNTHVYEPLIKGRMVLVVLNKPKRQDFDSGIQDKQLKVVLNKQIRSDFYLASEYFDADPITIGSGGNEETKWGLSKNPSLATGESYRLAAVQVSEYCGVINIDTVLTETFMAQ